MRIPSILGYHQISPRPPSDMSNLLEKFHAPKAAGDVQLKAGRFDRPFSQGDWFKQKLELVLFRDQGDVFFKCIWSLVATKVTTIVHHKASSDSSDGIYEKRRGAFVMCPPASHPNGGNMTWQHLGPKDGKL